ncbi:MAG: homoserine kinase [Chlamydiota bacterium]|nr:homoserine kinase [Chlamydiota bacterium]
MRHNKYVKVRVPASTSNLGSGFDSIGMGLDLYNEFEITVEKKGIKVEVVGEGEDKLPKNKQNLVCVAMDLAFKRLKFKPKGLRIRTINHIPMERGLGSSAAAIIGGILAANALAGNQLSEREILDLAFELEKHPDNLVSALLGGITLATVEDGHIVYMGLPVPLELKVVLVIPDFTLSTHKARSVLPKKINFSDAVFNLGRASMLTASLIAGRYDLMRIAVQDKLHQPYRFMISPKMKKIFDIASDSGGCATALSGAGSSILTFVNHHVHPNEVAQNVMRELINKKITCQVKVLDIVKRGALVEAH